MSFVRFSAEFEAFAGEEDGPIHHVCATVHGLWYPDSCLLHGDSCPNSLPARQLHHHKLARGTVVSRVFQTFQLTTV